MGILKFYGFDKNNGQRRIFAFKVDSLKQAENALMRMNIQSGWYHSKSGEQTKIDNHYYFKNSFSNIFDKIDKLQKK